jgi:hypothetical protein
MTHGRIRLAVASALVFSLAAASIALAATRDHGKGGHSQDGNQFQAQLIGYEEVPSINSPGVGDVSVTVGTDQLTYELSFSGITPMVAHVHVGQVGVSGGISFFLCGGGGKPACTSGMTGTIVPGDALAIAGQGFSAGDLDAVIAAMRAGVTYANMHTTAFPNGEIRGQLEQENGAEDDDDD